jgi:hypothetical protein
MGTRVSFGVFEEYRQRSNDGFWRFEERLSHLHEALTIAMGGLGEAGDNLVRQRPLVSAVAGRDFA